MNDTEDQKLNHFLSLARRGRHRESSRGERRAIRLALEVLEELPGLDHDAVEGLKAFISLVEDNPMSVREMFHHHP